VPPLWWILTPRDLWRRLVSSDVTVRSIFQKKYGQTAGACNLGPAVPSNTGLALTLAARYHMRSHKLSAVLLLETLRVRSFVDTSVTSTSLQSYPSVTTSSFKVFVSPPQYRLCLQRGATDSSLPMPMTDKHSRALSSFRRSPRLLAATKLVDGDGIKEIPSSLGPPPTQKRNNKRSLNPKMLSECIESKRKAVEGSDGATSKPDDKESAARTLCLPRIRERALLKEPSILYVVGIDEAGRGPLCGPVVAAAAMVPSDINGVTDSKKLKNEASREELYEGIVSSPNVRWAVAVIDAARIDEINILQATLEGMRLACQGVMAQEGDHNRRCFAAISEAGCYVVCGATDSEGKSVDLNSRLRWESDDIFALVDGNRLPKDMPCEAEPMIKGDSREYTIAAASILAKVTRDRLMNGYDVLYPNYDLKQNKGYPTAAHMAAVRKHGASPIHRRSFAPLKHMKLDSEGKILDDS
jgi:ribonuclease HII